MNIEQLAHEVSSEMSKEARAMEGRAMMAEFLRRCLSKLTEQDVEPSFWLCREELFEVEQRFFPPNNGPIPGQEKLYTETQLLAAQQRTAEACAKLLNDNLEYLTRGDALVAIRNGEWREYL